MPLGKGYWFVTHNFDLIDIVEHEGYLRDLSNAMWTSPDTVGPREYAQATTLGMKPGEPWLESVSRETPSVRRARWLKEAMKRGWVRIRQAPNRMMVFEAWKVNDDLLASLGLAVKQMGLSPETPIEIHEVSSDRPRAMTAGALRAYLAGEESEATGEVGFSVYSNPGGKKAARRVFGRERGAKREFPADVAVLGGGFDAGPLNEWHPLEQPKLFGQFMRANPYAQQEYINVRAGQGETLAQIFLGMRTTVNGKIHDIDPTAVFNWVKEFRTRQLGGGGPGGASFISQRGFFTYWEDHPAGVTDEDSLQILFYPDGRPGDAASEVKADYKPILKTFKLNMHELAPAIAEAFGQKAVILRLVLDGKMSYFGDYHQKK